MIAETTPVQSDSYKWLVLTLAAFTYTFVVAIPQMITFREAIGQVMRLRNVWILCIATAGVSGCVNGMLGFLPRRRSRVQRFRVQGCILAPGLHLGCVFARKAAVSLGLM
jgi:hypothetical protein